MRFVLSVIAVAGLLLWPLRLQADGTRVVSVDPVTAKAGDVVSVTGEGIDSASIDALYLTNGTEDIKVQILEQNEKLIKFKVPTGVKPGRWALMVRTKGPDPRLLEQPVKITVE
jgi:hypothetical protein